MPPDQDSAELVKERSSALEARAISGSPQTDTTAAVFGTEPPWLLPPNLTEIEWEIYAFYPNYLAAQIVAGLFENEGLPSIVVAWTSLPGVGSATVWVPKLLMHRARWIAAQEAPTEAALLFLATGEFSSGKEQEQCRCVKLSGLTMRSKMTLCERRSHAHFTADVIPQQNRRILSIVDHADMLAK